MSMNIPTDLPDGRWLVDKHGNFKLEGRGTSISYLDNVLLSGASVIAINVWIVVIIFGMQELYVPRQ